PRIGASRRRRLPAPAHFCHHPVRTGTAAGLGTRDWCGVRDRCGAAGNARTRRPTAGGQRRAVGRCGVRGGLVIVNGGDTCGVADAVARGAEIGVSDETPRATKTPAFARERTSELRLGKRRHEIPTFRVFVFSWRLSSGGCLVCCRVPSRRELAA